MASTEYSLLIDTTGANIQIAFDEWFEAMTTGASNPQPQRWWLSDLGIGVEREPGGVHSLTVYNDFRVRTALANIPADPATVNGLTHIAIKGERRYLVRQGWLRPRGDDKEVRFDAFGRYSGLISAFSFTTSATQREWYVVADLDAEAATIQAQTANFVHACERARRKVAGLP